MTTPETKTITAEVPAALLDQIDKYAARSQRSRDWVLNEALQYWLRVEAGKDALTREPAAEMDVESWDSEYVLPEPKQH